MCASSVVSDYYLNTYPSRINPSIPTDPIPFQEGIYSPPPQIVVHQFDAETKELMRQAMIILNKIDKRLGDVECMDEAKKDFLKALDIEPAAFGG